MGGKREKPEDIVLKLRQVEVLQGQGKPLADAVRQIGVTVQTYYRWRRSWQTRRDAELAIFQYINGFCNPRRRHSALGWKSPVAFERKVA